MTSDPGMPPEPPPVDEPVHPTAGTSDAPPPRALPAKVPFTKVAATWWALIVGVLVLIILLIFIAQNLDSITLHFLGWRWNAPAGIALLVGAICGSLITVFAGLARMIQLRRVAKLGIRANRK
jgi:uncharacterized integral membrane protein